MIDTHCHLTFPEFESDPAGVLDRARSHGVVGAITICTTTQDAPRVLGVANRFENVWCSAGVHPLYAEEGPHDWGLMRAIGADRRCIAWGELGLDNHYSEPARETQRRVLDDQLTHILRWRAEGMDKPIVIHCREAFEDLLPVLRATGIPGERFVFHCFTGNADEARRVLDFGAHISFTGVVTYKSAEGVRDAARLAPADRIMVETDAPFLSPEPHRSVRPCEPWMTSVTARRLAEIRGEGWDRFHDQIDLNTERFFGIPALSLRSPAA